MARPQSSRYPGIMLSPSELARRRLARFGKVVIWGLRTSSHSHRYIHSHFHEALLRDNINSVWVDDLPDSADAIAEGDLVIAANVARAHLPERDRVFYCQHNFDLEGVSNEYKRELQVFTSGCLRLQDTEKWDPVTVYSRKTRRLYQPWGTNLAPEEFKPPVASWTRKLPVSFFVGTPWKNDDDGNGNLRELAQLRRALAHRMRMLLTASHVSDSTNIRLIRFSCVAPAIGGEWQAHNGYLPCRMFKNVSYGQLGFSNIKAFGVLFKDATIAADTVDDLLDLAFSLPSVRFREVIRAQQEIVKQHTYSTKLANIAKTFE